MNLLVKLTLLWAACFGLIAFAAALAFVYYDFVCPLLDRRRSRIKAPDSTTFVEDPFPTRRYGDPMKVIGGAGAGSTTALLVEDDDA
jgi:hypothetical protein